MLAKKVLFALFAAALSLSASAALAGEDFDLSAPAPRIDNGLGELQPFETWTYPWIYAVPGESLDNGVGNLAPYSEWRYAWVYSMPAEKIDSGLGEIRPATAAGPALAERRTQ